MKNKNPVVPSLRDDPEYARADDLCNKLARDVAELQRRLNEKRAAQKKQPAEISATVKRLLGDPVPEGDGETIPQMEQKIRETSAAHTIAIRRREVARIPAGKLAFQKVESDYKSNVSDICDLMVTINAAVAHYQGLVDELERNDIPYHCWARPMLPLFIGRPNDPQGVIAFYLAEAATYKLIDARSIPEGLRR